MTQPEIIHRCADFESPFVEYGQNVCGEPGPCSIMHSGYNCPQCAAQTPGLQALAMIENALWNLDPQDLPRFSQQVREYLQYVQEELNHQQT